MCFGRVFLLILMHFYILYSMLWGKISKNQVFSSKKHFFQNFDWSNLIFDQSKSCFKNSVSLCLVQLIEPVFRSIEHRILGFLKTSSLTVSNILFKSFSTFSLSLTWQGCTQIFCRFLPQFLQGFPPSRPVWPFYPPFRSYFHFFMHFFMHLKGIFGPFESWDFCWFKAIFLKLIIGFCWFIVIFRIVVG